MPGERPQRRVTQLSPFEEGGLPRDDRGLRVWCIHAVDLPEGSTAAGRDLRMHLDLPREDDIIRGEQGAGAVGPVGPHATTAMSTSEQIPLEMRTIDAPPPPGIRPLDQVGAARADARLYVIEIKPW